MFKKTIYLLIFALFSLSAFAQSGISIDVKNQPLKTVMESVSAQSNYRFVYTSELKVEQYSVTLVSKNEAINTLLGKIFNPLNISYEIKGNQIVLGTISKNSVKVTSVEKKPQGITGTITDETGELLAGVVIKNETNQKYSYSDDKGKYSLDAKEGDVLSFFLVGMKTANVTVGKSALVNIQMQPDAIALQDVVITGYQTITREKVTGAVTSINTADLTQKMTTNILDNLEGRVAGLMVYNGGMQIRGISSIHSERDPLLVVDGMPVEMEIEDLNPYDIENITILKDAAAAAIYGVRASNGILVVTTKSAKTKGKTDVDVTVNYTMYDKTNVDYHDNFYMNASEQVDSEIMQLDQLATNPMLGMYVPMYGTMGSMYSFQPLSALYMTYYSKLTGQITEDQYNSTISRMKGNNYAKEVADNILTRHQLQQYNIALRNRSEKFSSNMVINYQRDNQGVKKSGSNQFNIAYRGGYDVGKWLSTKFGISSIINNSTQTGDAYATNPFVYAPYESLFNEDGTLANLSMWGLSNNLYSVPAGYKSNFYNPLQEMDENRINTKSISTRLQGELLFKIIEGLTINTQFLYETSTYNQTHYMSPESIVMRTFVNAYTEINPDGSLNYLVPNTGGYLATTNTTNESWTGRGQLNFNRSFGKHSIDFLAGLEFRQTFYKGTRGLMLGYDDQLQSHTTLSIDYPFLSKYYSNPYYGSFYSSQFMYNTYINGYINPVKEQKHRYASGYANLTYTYNERYNLFGSFRTDYADIYGLDTKFRGTPLWSVGASWNIDKESFMKAISWLDALKLRTSYGITGNIYQGATSYMTASTGSMNESTLLPISVVQSPANPELRWEKTTTMNVGVDFSLFNYRLNGSIDFYNKKGTDIFANALLEDSKGFSSMAMNAASILNNGVEVMLSGDIFKPKSHGGFQWTSSATFSFNKNIVTEVENDATAAYELWSTPYKKGYPVSAVWGLMYAGMTPVGNPNGSMHLYYTDQTRTTTSSSVWSSNPDDVCRFMGQSDPKVAISWENKFRFKNFSLSAMMVYYGGHVMTMRPIAPMSILSAFTNTHPTSIEYLDAWTPENSDSTVPGIGIYGVSYTSTEYQMGDIYVKKGDFLKIRNIVFGYDLPKKWLSAINISNATLRFQIDNPKYLWVNNDLGVDPETGGISRPTSYVFGLNINF